MTVQPEAPDHHAAVRQLHIDGFPTPAEADLVERLRHDGDARISLVAIEDGRVVGHVMFSTMDAPFRALGLAPVAVAADKRRQGIAARLIRAGIDQARAEGWDGIFVLGDPAYYRRFGFSVDTASPFESPYAGPYLMLLVLKGDGLQARAGRIDYAPAFDALA